MANEALPGQMTVEMLIERLRQEQPGALVVYVDPWNSSMVVLNAITEVEGNGGPVVKLHSKGIEQ